MSNNKEIEDFYKWLAVSYAKMWGWRPDALIRRWKRLSPVLRKNDAKRILDVACGIGRDSLELARSGFEVVGVDASEDMISIARDKAHSERLKVELLLGDMYHLSDLFPKQRFDAAICVGNSLLHADNKEQIARCVKSMKNVLKPKGVLLLQCQITDNSIQKETKPRLQVTGVFREKDTTEVFLRRTVYRWDIERIERSFIRLVLSADDCTVEERATDLQMITKREIEDIVRASGFSSPNVYDDKSMDFYCSLKSDGVLVIAKLD